MSATPTADPYVPDWANLELPDAWPDQLRLTRPLQAWRLLRGPQRRKRRVLLPAGTPGQEWLPKYLFQEFHGLPNGNFSKRVTPGYIIGFDRAMAGRMHTARARIADALQGCRSVLDVGCGGGRTAAMVRASGASDVWGIDPSPYLLQHAARANPEVRFVQGIAERTGFPTRRFDGIAVCFVFHEIAPRYIGAAFRELHRVLKPGGLLAICEPSAAQLRKLSWRLLREEGPMVLYFNLLARSVHEPYVQAWHRRDVGASLQAAGFEVLSDCQAMPVRHLLARRPT